MTEYNFSHPKRGTAIIINNVDFYNASKRLGSDKDMQILSDAFLNLGFNAEDIIIERNQKTTDMEKLLEDAVLPADRKEDNANSDCFVCAILTHGSRGQIESDTEGGVDVIADHVHGINGSLPIRDLIKIVAACPELAGKPKIFLIQACRGTKKSDPVSVKHVESDPGRSGGTTGGSDGIDATGDAGESLAATLSDQLVLSPVPSNEDKQQDEVEPPFTEDELEELRQMALLPFPVDSPVFTDCIIAYATQPGFFAFRNEKYGSPFIRKFHSQVLENGQSLDFLRLLTRVNRDVAYGFQAKNKYKKEYDGKKMMPWISSRLKKDIVFHEKTM